MFRKFLKCLTAAFILAVPATPVLAAANDTLFLAFTPGPSTTGATSPESCATAIPVSGSLTASSREVDCQTGPWGTSEGSIAGAPQIDEGPAWDRARFSGEKLGQPLKLEGHLTLALYHSHQAPSSGLIDDRVTYRLLDIGFDGSVATVAKVAEGSFGPGAGTPTGDGGYLPVRRQEVTLSFPAYTVPAGNHVEVEFESAGAAANGGRLIYGGTRYGDAGVTLRLGSPAPQPVPVPAPAPNPAKAGALTLQLQPLDTPEAGPLSPEMCFVDPGYITGVLGTPGSPDTQCHTGVLGDGYKAVYVSDPRHPEAAVPSEASFTSAPFPEGLNLAGPMSLRAFVAYDPIGPGNAISGSLWFALEEVRPDGTASSLYSGSFGYVYNMGFQPNGAKDVSGTFDIGRHSLVAGSRLRLRLDTPWTTFRCDSQIPECLVPPQDPHTHLESVVARLLYGGRNQPTAGLPGSYDFSGSGISLAVADPAAPDETSTPDPSRDPAPSAQPSNSLASSGGGSLPGFLLLPLAVAGLLRRVVKSVGNFASQPTFR